MKGIIEWLYSLKTDKCLHFIAGLVVAQIAFALLRLATFGTCFSSHFGYFICPVNLLTERRK